MRARLAPDRRTLDRAYKAARKEEWCRQLAAEWVSRDGEGWPSVISRYRLGATSPWAFSVDVSLSRTPSPLAPFAIRE